MYSTVNYLPLQINKKVCMQMQNCHKLHIFICKPCASIQQKLSPPYLVVVQNPLCKGLVQHFPVPLLQSLRLWDLLVRRMAVEDVVVSFTGRTCPDVALGIPEGIHRPNIRPKRWCIRHVLPRTESHHKVHCLDSFPCFSRGEAEKEWQNKMYPSFLTYSR